MICKFTFIYFLKFYTGDSIWAIDDVAIFFSFANNIRNVDSVSIYKRGKIYEGCHCSIYFDNSFIHFYGKIHDFIKYIADIKQEPESTITNNCVKTESDWILDISEEKYIKTEPKWLLDNDNKIH